MQHFLNMIRRNEHERIINVHLVQVNINVFVGSRLILSASSATSFLHLSCFIHHFWIINFVSLTRTNYLDKLFFSLRGYIQKQQWNTKETWGNISTICVMLGKLENFGQQIHCTFFSTRFWLYIQLFQLKMQLH